MNVSIDLQNPITLPANGQSLEKSGDKFVVDSSDESHPLIGIMHILNWTPRSQTTEWYIGME